MNKIDKNPNYKEIYAFIKEKFEKTSHFGHGPFDETYFSMRVYESAKQIMEKLEENVKREQVLTAALLHDVGKTKLQISKIFSRYAMLENATDEWLKHAQISAKIARPYLREMGHSENFINEVCYLIAHHDMRGSKMGKRSLELSILQDADIIADIGVAGFTRVFSFGAKFKRSVVDSIRFLQTDDRTQSGSDINLEISRNIAEREMEIQKNLAKEVLKELDSDLL